MSDRRLRLIVGIGGASGAAYACRLLDHLVQDRRLLARVEPHIVFSKMGRVTWSGEVQVDIGDRYPGLPIHDHNALSAPVASGSAQYDAMIIMPCSASGLGRIANGVSTDLLGRAAEVTLKERRPLVLGLRETPYHLPLIRNMATLTEAGATVLPLSPSFYANPFSIDDLLDTVVSRALDLVGVENDLTERWHGSYPGAVDPIPVSIASQDTGFNYDDGIPPTDIIETPKLDSDD